MSWPRSRPKRNALSIWKNCDGRKACTCAAATTVYKLTRAVGYKCTGKGTIFEESRLRLTWFAASWLITAHRKGISGCQRPVSLARQPKDRLVHAWPTAEKVAAQMGALPMQRTVEIENTMIFGQEKQKQTPFKTD